MAVGRAYWGCADEHSGHRGEPLKHRACSFRSPGSAILSGGEMEQPLSVAVMTQALVTKGVSPESVRSELPESSQLVESHISG